MKKFFAVILCFVFSLTFLCSCSKDKKAQSGIVITDKKIEYSATARSDANDAVYGFVVATYGQVYSVNSVTKPGIVAFCNDLVKSVSAQNVSENTFEDYFKYVSGSTEEYRVRFHEYNEGNISLYECFGEIIDKTVEIFGVRSLSDIVKRLISFTYDRNIADAKNKLISVKGNATLEKYYEEEEKTLSKEKAVLDGIDANSFKNLIKSGIMLYKIYSKNETTGDVFDNFSDSELALFGRNLNFEVNLSLDEWKVVFKQAKALGEASKEFFTAVENNGKQKKLATFLNDAFLFLQQTQKNLTEEHVKVLKEKDGEKFLSYVFSTASDEQWETVERLCGLQLKESGFTAFVEKQDFMSVVISAQKKEYNDLKECRQGDYVKTLLGIAHGVFYD